jgi:hypothetical protein
LVARGLETHLHHDFAGARVQFLKSAAFHDAAIEWVAILIDQ